MSAAASSAAAVASNNAFLNNLLEHSQIPAATAPPGQVHNLINPYSRGYLAYVTIGISLPIMLSLIVIRVYTKHFVNKFGLDRADYTCVAAFIAELAYMALGQVGAHWGGGIHQWNLSTERAIHIARIANVMEIVYNPAAFLTKLAITLQILRIFAGVHRGWVFWLSHTTIWFNLLFQTAMMFVAIFHCQPAAKYWEPWLPGHCIPPNAPLIVSAAVSTATDLVLFLVPIICIWKLQMSSRQKWGVSVVFATASFAVICSIMRIFSTVWFIRAEDDATWGFVDLALWTFGEVGGGIASSCMPVIPQFVRHVGPKISSVFASIAPSSKHPSSSAAQSPAAFGSPRKGRASPFNWSKATTAVHSRETAPGSPKPKSIWSPRETPLGSKDVAGASVAEVGPEVPPKDSKDEGPGSWLELEEVERGERSPGTGVVGGGGGWERGRGPTSEDDLESGGRFDRGMPKGFERVVRGNRP